MPASPAHHPPAAHHGPTMWAGTNSGSVFAYALEVPAAAANSDRRPERAVEAVLGKEVQLMHRAPVVAVAVLDGRGRPLPEPYEASRDLAQAPDMQGGHAVLIASEEQFKVSWHRDPWGFRLLDTARPSTTLAHLRPLAETSREPPAGRDALGNPGGPQDLDRPPRARGVGGVPAPGPSTWRDWLRHSGRGLAGFPAEKRVGPEGRAGWRHGG